MPPCHQPTIPPLHQPTTLPPPPHHPARHPPARDFVFAALLGGGAMAALALREDDPFANKLGEAVMGVINKAD